MHGQNHIKIPYQCWTLYVKLHGVTFRKTKASILIADSFK